MFRGRSRARPRRAAEGASRRFRLGAALRQEERRGRTLPLRRIAVLTVLLLALAGGGYGGSRVLTGDTLRARDVTVVGARIMDPRSIAAAADVAGRSLLTLDTEAAARRVAALPGVREARVQRDWPRGVIIDVSERQGWGYWQTAGVRRVIDIDGRVLDRARPPAGDAPTIIEFGPPLDSEAGIAPDPDTVRLVDRLLSDGTFDLLRVRPAGFLFSGERGLTVLVEDAPHAVFGDSANYEFKVAAWGALLDRIEERRIEVREIDLRFGSHLVLR